MSEGRSKPNQLQTETGKNIDTQFIDAVSFNWQPRKRSSAWRPPTDVFESDNDIIVRVEIAGMQEDGFSVELNGRHLVIRGIRQDSPERRAYHQMEIRFGEFIIELELPSFVDTEKVEAIYINGFLRVTLPKTHPHQISITE